MSAAAVLSAVQGFVCEASLDVQARTDLIDAVFALDKAALQFFYDVAVDAGHTPDDIRRRVVAVTLEYAAVQVADDLADGEGSYIESFSRAAPGVAWGLQHLFFLACARAGLSLDAITRASARLLRMLDGQQRDVRTTEWELRSARAAARMNELQFSAYFDILLGGTRHAAEAVELGEKLGFALHVVGDSRSADPRIATLAGSERVELLEQALGVVSELERSALGAVARHARHYQTYLRTELRRAAG